MKSDLPALMHQRNLDALVIIGPDGMGSANTAFSYFVGAAHVTNGTILVKRAGDSTETFLVHHAMERDEAAKTGLSLINKSAYKLSEIIAAKGGNRVAAEAELLRRICAEKNITGRIGFYGAEQIGTAVALLEAVRAAGFCTVATEPDNDVIAAARKTKDGAEATLIRDTCRLTEEVISATRAFIAQHKTKGDAVLKADGSALTVGDVKRVIRRETAERGLVLPGGDCIFAIGRDAGVPHSGGEASDPILLGRTIVFDIYPAGPGGYHSDITRTWCFGYAPEHVQRAYADVMQVHGAMEDTFDTSAETWTFQEKACLLFESLGHPTIRENTGQTSGYVHGLGHGFGLGVHEAPSMSNRGLRAIETLAPGTILCNEPGLYYPEDPRGGWGVRVEDDYWVSPAGTIERLTEVDRSLVIPMAG